MDLSKVVYILSIILFLGCYAISAHADTDSDEDCPNGKSFEEDHQNGDDDAGHESENGDGENHEMHHDHGDSEIHEADDHEDHTDCEATSYDFDGVSFYEILQKSSELKDFTLGVYITTDGNGVVSGPIFSIHSTELQSFTVYGGMQNSTGYLKIVLEGQQRKVMTSFNPNTKYHIAIVVNSMSNSVSVFIDGKLLKQVSFSSITGLQANGQITIGNAVGNTYKPYQGNMQNMMLWNRMLKITEIEELHEHNHCIHDPVLILHEHNMVPQKYGVPTIECPEGKYIFNNTGGRVEYIEINAALPQLEFATICAKITTNARGIIPGTIGSYGTKDEPEGISITGFVNSKGEAKNTFVIHSQIFTLPGQFQPNTKYSMCIVYYFKHNHLMTYINNQAVTMIQYQGRRYLPGGGKLILGQRQRKQGGCFDYPYTGKVQDFILWQRVLTREEVQGYAEGKCPSDKIISAKRNEVTSHNIKI